MLPLHFLSSLNRSMNFSIELERIDKSGSSADREGAGREAPPLNPLNPEEDPQSVDRTPPGNTGVRLPAPSDLRFGLDWLRGTFHHSNFEGLKADLEDFLGYVILPTDRPCRGYDKKWHSASGVIMATEPQQSKLIENRQDNLVEFPGSVLAALTESQWTKLCVLLSNHGFRCTRLDVYIDDYSKAITPTLLHGAVLANNFSGFLAHTRKFIDSAEDRACTLTLGRRGGTGSGKYFRCYDKYKQTQGEHDSTRVEVEFSGTKSREFFEAAVGYLAAGVPWGEFVKSLISGAIDFRDREGGKRRSARSPRFDWWEAVIGDSVPLRAATPIRRVSLDSMKQWLSYQVAPTLSAVMQASLEQDDTGDSWWTFFWELVFNGDSRFRDKHRFAIAQVAGLSPF